MTHPWSTMSTRSEHVVDPRNAHLLTRKTVVISVQQEHSTRYSNVDVFKLLLFVKLVVMSVVQIGLHVFRIFYEYWIK